MSDGGTAGLASPDSRATPRRRNLVIGLVILPLLPVTVWLDAFVSGLFHVTDLWPGYLFVASWMAGGRIELKSFSSCAIAALLGFGLAMLLRVLPLLYGESLGMAAAGLPITAVVYLLMSGKARFFVNIVTMLFLTVYTIPQIQAHTQVSSLVLATVVGIGFFGTLILGHVAIRSVVLRWRVGERAVALWRGMKV